MAVNADPTNRELMKSTTPAHRKTRTSTNASEADADDYALALESVVPQTARRHSKMLVVQRRAQALDCRQSAPPYRLETQRRNNNG
jgi:hypothetical protein